MATKRAAAPAPAIVAPELGTSGLRQSSGWLREERLVSLQGRRGKEKYREMADRDAIIGACLGYTKSLIKRLTYRCEPAADDQDARRAAQFCWECLNDMNQPFATGFLDEALSMIEFGFSGHEVVYKRRLGASADDGSSRSRYEDGLIGVRKIAQRAQETVDHWDMDPHGGIRGFWQTTETRGAVFIPIERAVLFRTTTARNNPEGRSMLRNAYESWYYATKLRELQALGFERDAAGIPVMGIPVECFSRTATDDQKATLTAAQEIVKNVKMDKEQGIVMPIAYHATSNQELYKLSLLTSGGQKAFDADAMITRYEQRMAMALLADFVMLGHEAIGSYALSRDKTSLYGIALEVIADAVCEPVSQYVLPRLVAANGWDPRLAPALAHSPVEDVDLRELVEVVGSMVDAGMQWYDELEAYLLSLAHLPQRPAEGEPRRAVRDERRPLRRPSGPPPATRPPESPARRQGGKAASRR